MNIQQIIEKQLTVDNAGALDPEELDPELQEIADEKLVLRKVFKRVPWGSSVYPWNVREALTSATSYDATATFSGGESTIERRNVTIKRYKAEGGVDGLLEDVSADLIASLDLEIEGAEEALLQKIERDMILGDSSDTTTQFDGLNVQIDNSNTDISTDVEVNATGDSINFDMLDDAIAYAREEGGNPDLIFLSQRDKSQLDKLMRNEVKVNWERVETKFGVRLQTYQDIPVIASPFMPTNLAYGSTPTEDYSIGFVLDTSKIVVPTVRDISYKEIGLELDGTFFRLRTYLALAVKVAEYQRKITNIGKPTTGLYE